MSLTESKLRQAKPTDKIYFLSDDDGLSLKIEPNGTKTWSYRYTQAETKKRSRIKLGVYPIIGLKEARQKRDEYKVGIHQLGSITKKNSILMFSQIASEWLLFKKKNALGDEPRCGVIELSSKCLHSDILPELGEIPFKDVQR